MKLIHIYIENFGGLHQFELAFDAGLTVLREDNGFGKTTLAEFIRAMFYGFPRQAKTLDKNRRKKYLPWGGGICGGHLTFELEGTRYRIERTFGTTPRGDTFTLIDLSTNRKSIRFTENIGPELFGLDGDSFERSTYMPQLQEAESLSTDSIQAKLGDLVEDTNDVGNFENAVAALRAKRSSYVPYRGSGGLVAEARNHVSRLQQKLDDAQAKNGELIRLRQRMQELEQQLERDGQQLAQVRLQLTEASKAAARDAARLQHRRMEAQHRQLRESLDSRFDRGVPGTEAFEQAERDCEEYVAVTARLGSDGMSAGERAQLKALEVFFAPGIPDEQTLDTLIREQRRMIRLQAELDGQGLHGQEQTLLAEAEQKLNKAMQQWKMRKKKGRSWAMIALILGILALGSGIMLVAAGNVLPGLIGIAIGLPGLLLGSWMLFSFCSGAVPEELRQRRMECQALARRAEELEHSRSQIRKEAESCRRALAAKLKPYFGSDCDPEQAIVDLRMKRSRYLQLRQLRSESEGRCDALTRRAEELEQGLRDFLEDYCDEIQPTRFGQLLTRLRRDCDAYSRTKLQLEELERQLEASRQEHGEILDHDEAAPDPEQLQLEERQLNERLDANKRSLLETEQQAAVLRREIDGIPALREELEHWQQRKEADQHRADTLDRTMEFLQQARESLSGNYLSTIRRSFGQYLGRLSGEDRQKILVTGDLEVQLERQGQSRELTYFSAGQTDLVMLCMRFALVDALFTQEKPFVILDDPFVNLDDEHTAEALALLQDLSRDRQIIYLTCHSSRA